MRLLLDTHILLWWLANSKQLPGAAKLLIENPRNSILISSASVWEVAVKRSLGRIQIDLSALDKAVIANGFRPVDVAIHHVLELSSLPLHHRDPFDRMLVAQAIVETAHLLTHDVALSQYGKVVMVV